MLLNQSKYDLSYKYLKKLDGLEESHFTFSSKYLYTLVNSGNLNQALNFSKKLERNKKESFESYLISGIYYLKNSKYNLANEYFLKARKIKSRTILDSFIMESLFIWSNLKNSNLEQATLSIDKFDNRFENLKKIQNVFLNCYFSSNKTNTLFDQLTSNIKTDFSRYNYFHAKYLVSIGKNEEAKIL